MIRTSCKIQRFTIQVESLEFFDDGYALDASLALNQATLNEFFRSVTRFPLGLTLDVGKESINLQMKLDGLKASVSLVILAWERGIALKVKEALLLGFIPIRGWILDALEGAVFKLFDFSRGQHADHCCRIDITSLLPPSVETRIHDVTLGDQQVVVRFSQKRRVEKQGELLQSNKGGSN